MIPHIMPTRDELLEAVFSEEPAPDIHAAVIVAHRGDECIGASWLLSRLFDRLSVFRAADQACSEHDAITLTGLPVERCHGLGFRQGTLACSIADLAWLLSATLQPLAPRMLVTHAVEGINLDHDALAVAVQLAGSLLPRFASAPPVLLEFQCHHDGPEAVHHDQAAPAWEKGVRVDFGPDSRRLKERILRSQLGSSYCIHRSLLGTEIYRPQSGTDLVKTPQSLARCYVDAPQVSVGQFLANASAVARTFVERGLIVPASL